MYGFPQHFHPPLHSQYPVHPPSHGGQHYQQPGWGPLPFPQSPSQYLLPQMPPTQPMRWTPRRVAISGIEARVLLAAPQELKAKEQLLAALARFYRGEHPVRATLQKTKNNGGVMVLRPLPAGSAYYFFSCMRSGGDDDPASKVGGGGADASSANGAGAGAAAGLDALGAVAMGADELLDHLIVSAMEGGLDGGAGAPAADARANSGRVLGLSEVQSALNQPVRGVRVSESTLNFGVVERGSSEKLSLLVINGSVDGCARLRAVRVLGAEAVFRLAEPEPPLEGGGALLPPGGRVEVHIAFDAVEVGLYRSWLFLLVDVLWSSHRTFTSSAALFGCVLGGAVMPPGHGARKLSSEARPFIPDSLRAIWLAPGSASALGGPLALPPPPFRPYACVHTVPSYSLDAALAPAWREMVGVLGSAMDELLPRAVRRGRAPHTLAQRPTAELCGFSLVSWERSTAIVDPNLADTLAEPQEPGRDGVWRKGPGIHTPPEVVVAEALRRAGLADAGAPIGFAAPPAAAVWELLHLKRLGLLLQLEELRMADDYAKMDSFSTPVRRNRPAQKDDGTPILRASIVGLEERHPPALVGDALLLRPAALPELEVPCRIIGIDRRTEVLFVPAWQADRPSLRQLLVEPNPALWVERLVRQMAPYADEAAVGRARSDLELLFCPAPVPPAQGHALAHIRFLLNRSAFEHMHLNLQAAIERMEVRLPEAGLPFGISLLPVDEATVVEAARDAQPSAAGGERAAEAGGRGEGLEAPAAGRHAWTAEGVGAETPQGTGAAEGVELPVLPVRAESGVDAAAEAAGYADMSPASTECAVAADSDGCAPLNPFTSNINPEQLAAVEAFRGPREAMRHRCERMPPYLVFGPPGTGKTVVVVELVLQLLACHPDPRLLVCAPSNSAADVLLARVHSRIDELQARLSADPPAWSQAGSGGRGLDRLVYRLNSQTRNVEDVRPELLRYCSVDSSVNQFSILGREALLTERAIICTCAATRMMLEVGVPCSASPRFSTTTAGLQELVDADGRRLHFTHVLIDEASQALEPEMLLPLAFAGPGCDVLICGDHKQLGPTVRSSFCRENGLATSMLERLIQLPAYRDATPAHDGRQAPPAGGAEAQAQVSDGAVRADGAEASVEARERGASLARLPGRRRLPCDTRLVRNYRSHRSLLALPSRLFYDGTLRECADARQTSSLERWGELRRQGFPLLFYGVRSAHTHELDSPSFFNPVEAEKARAARQLPVEAQRALPAPLALSLSHSPLTHPCLPAPNPSGVLRWLSSSASFSPRQRPMAARSRPTTLQW